MGINVSTENMEKVFERTEGLKKVKTHYCPGCGHGVVHRLTMETVMELGIQDKTIGIAPVGCSVFAYYYMNVDMQQAAHGRACAVATGIKRMLPNHYVFTYQGDGDLAAIGTAETIHACSRGENITIIFINNAIYGMTGGQMAPTTIEGQKTSTSPEGRDYSMDGMPINMSEIVALLPGTVYVERLAVNNPGRVRKTKKAIMKAFKAQELKKGTSFIEVVSNCNTNWKMTPVEANKWIDDVLLKQYPLGVFKDETGIK
ncbi:2-oxoglutarate ferredoxin oxidoreductase subunit beta [Thermotomaculum hydrothermale]|uniref:2-oxoglutarate ferredoxin oxidoreductase subunit beta n=1 Tax=Thermotomaculum hydrothermale TaxID=981385 RepID=A0A7R6PM77_9BACT|nr:thiamine pyrophosphate-dependent enzyme [Thermotomaculum hydrothermale]BBB32138.1 2-oxoglutarate ferredoxin oxidoreductase subunit beta [Thermotomaculum hydrothermale]